MINILVDNSGSMIELGKKDIQPSLIGLMLRDSKGIPSVKKITGKSITEILKENNLFSEIPEDLGFLVKKYNNIKKHLENNKRDVHNKRSLSLIESKIRRLMKYYKRVKKIPENWKYNN